MINVLGRTLAPPSGTRLASGRVGGLPAVRVTHQTADPERAILFLHGGGYGIGSSISHRGIAGYLSRAARANVYLPDYRLAPEHPYPAALEDALAAYRALVDAGHSPERTAIGGDSAGGGLTLATAVALRDAGGPSPAVLLLICPWLDLTLTGSSFTANVSREPILTPRASAADSAAYSGTRDPSTPGISPLFADLAGLPPIVLQGAGDDLIVSDADRLADRAGADGLSIEYRRYDGLWHDFQLYVGMLREAEAAVEEAGSALRRAWGEAG
jgi:monoterpene epsilon-lactone hydrolase